MDDFEIFLSMGGDTDEAGHKFCEDNQIFAILSWSKLQVCQVIIPLLHVNQSCDQ